MARKAALQIVVEGIGGVVQDYYQDALHRAKLHRGDQLDVTFVDQSSFWRNNRNQEVIDRYQRFINGNKKWSRYIDKSTESGLRKYKDLKADVVFIATPDFTHVDIALEWLAPESRCRHILIEKPLDSSLDKARTLLSRIKEGDPKVRALDHYCARVIPITRELQMSHIIRDLGGIKSFNFYFLENGSGGDPVGPIEREGREKAVKNGLILDMMPHIPAVLTFFAIIETIRVTGVRVGRYTYIDSKGKARQTAIKTETFAHVQFSIVPHGRRQTPIVGNAYVGKGVGGVKSMGIRGDAKLLEFKGRNGKKFQLQFRPTDGFPASAILLDRTGKKRSVSAELPSKPYEHIIDRVIDKMLDTPKLDLIYDLTIEKAYKILVALDEMRHLVKKGSIPPYEIGKGGEEAPMLEELLKLEPVQEFLYPF